jgi:Tfp pilus assembly major pilin PilA
VGKKSTSRIYDSRASDRHCRYKLGILAAITIVAYNNVQDRARLTVVNADLSNNNKVAKLVGATTGNSPTTLDVLQSPTKMIATRGGV